MTNRRPAVPAAPYPADVQGPHRAQSAPDAPTFAHSLERGLQLVVGLVIGAKTIVFCFEIASRPDRDATVLLLAGVVVTTVGIAAALCLAGRSGLLGVALATVALVAGCLLPRDGVPLPGAANSPILHLVEPMLLAIVARRHAGANIAALDVLFVCLRWATDGSLGLRYGVQEAVFITGTVLGALVLVLVMRAAADRAEAALAEDRIGRMHGPTRGEVEATSALHDDVIPALLAMADSEPSEATRSAATTGLEAIGARPAASRALPLSDQVRGLAQGTGVEVTTEVSGRPVRRLPDDVREALGNAVRESLRNVARHSGRMRATIRVERGSTHITLEVVDDGVGFEGPPGVGLRFAVMERVHAVGGTVEIASSPGAGTTVRLSWRARPLLARLLGWTPENDRLIRLAVGPPAVPALKPVSALAAGYAATAAILVVDSGTQPATYVGALCVAVVVGLLAWRMQRGPLAPVVLGAVVATTTAVLAAVLPTVPVSGLGGLESWIIECTALPALMVAWLQSIRVTALLLVPNAIVIAAVALDEGVTAADLPHLLFIQPLNALFVGVIAHVCRRAGRVVDDARPNESTERDAAARLVLGARRDAVVTALLAGSRGMSPTVDSARLARAIRDCLYLPGPIHEALRDELDDLRRRGAQVQTTIREEPPASDQLAGVLRALDGTPQQRVTLSTAGGQARIVVVPGVTGPAASALRAASPSTWTLVEDAEATVLTTAAAVAPRRAGGHDHSARWPS